jgi:tripartite-type tricarboxylate transporter receptor subunit TctC
MRRQRSRRGCRVSCLVSLTIAWLATSGVAFAQSTDFYAGKTLTIIVGLASGGTVDTFVRALTPHLRKHIVGNPLIVVQNMPGAGGLLATNFINERATPDGLTASYGPWDPLAQALGHTNLRVRYEQLQYYGGFADTRVLYARTDTVPGGIKAPADIMKAPIVAVGAQNATDLSGLLSAVALDLLGIKNKFVMGYRGGTEIFLALQRGEVQMHNTSIGTFRTRNASFIKSGEGIAICYLAAIDADGTINKSPHLPDLLALPELYKELNGKLPTGVEWETMSWLTSIFSDMAYIGFLPSKAPEPAVSAFRKGFELAMNDPEFIKQSIALNGVPYEPVSVEKARSIFLSLSGVKPEVLATAKKWLDAFGK